MHATEINDYILDILIHGIMIRMNIFELHLQPHEGYLELYIYFCSGLYYNTYCSRVMKKSLKVIEN